MLTKEMETILVSSKKRGWVMEPEAKTLFSLAGLDVPRFAWEHNLESALASAEKIGYPVVAKIVSPDIVHKSDAGGVIAGIKSNGELRQAFEAFGRITGASRASWSKRCLRASSSSSGQKSTISLVQ